MLGKEREESRNDGEKKTETRDPEEEERTN